MASPFKVFRQYQKHLLAGLAVMAIFAFVIGDPLIKMARGIAGSSKGQVVIESNVGELTQAELVELRNRRNVANQFMFQALRTSHPEIEKFPMLFPGAHMRFGPPTPRELVFAWLLRHEAHRMGIVVDNQQIERFLDQATNRKLTTPQFKEILDKMGMPPRELYGVLRDELTSLLAFELTVPSVVLSPEQYWRFYQQIHTRQKIEAAVLPIRDFTAKIPAPSEAELSRFFEAHKGAVDSSRNGEYRPGFRQPQRARLQYLAVTYKSAEEWVAQNEPITDSEIESYYEAKKDLDLRLQERGPATETPDGESAPLDPEFGPEADESQAPSGDEGSQPAAPNPCGDDKPTEDASAKPARPAEKAPPPLRYKPLDDELRDVIRETLLRERTLKRQRELQTQAADALGDIGLGFAKDIVLVKPSAQDLRRLSERSKQQMQSIAKRYDMRFGETPVVSREELRELPGIGRVQESEEGDELGSFGGRSILERAFESETLCSPMPGKDPDTGDLYVYWKIEDVPAHVPALSEPGVKEKVVEAWKHQQALPLAKKRADELAELVRKSSQPMEQVLSGQTVSGDAQAPVIAVRESPEFSWWKESFAPAEGLRRPQVRLGNPVVVPAVGLRFMQFVFDELQEKETGSTINDDASAYAVVRVVSRKPADREVFKDAPLFSPSSPYEVLAQRVRDQAGFDYSRKLEERYAVQWPQGEDGQPLTDADE